MKSFIFFSMLLATVGISCTNVPKDQGESLNITSPLIQDGYELFVVREPGRSIADHTYILAQKDKAQLKIRDTQGFAQLIPEISSEEDALTLVRLLSSQELRPFLQDVYYSEVHEKVTPQKKGEEEDRWFAIEAEQYKAWKLQEPKITKEKDGRYKIERFVASYPRIQGKELTPAQLLKIWEWVDSAGNYSMEVQEVITEGPEIQQILIFTK